eukprot:Nk52_evm42s296 gene=Nk52_evmTU42s296
MCRFALKASIAAEFLKSKVEAELIAETPTQQQSLNLVKNLLKTTISNISYLRNLFPEDTFHDRGLEGLQLKVLKRGNCPGADLLMNWMEKGCFDALQKHYLREIVLGISTDPEAKNSVMETYTFKFAYNKNEGEMEITLLSQKNQLAKTKTKTEIKKATVQMLRTLIVLTQTLKPLPDAKYISMKIFYYDERTPATYQPPFFKDCEENIPFEFVDEPLNIKVGNIDTPHHSLKLRIQSGCQRFAIPAEEETASSDREDSITTSGDSPPISPSASTKTQPTQIKTPSTVSPHSANMNDVSNIDLSTLTIDDPLRKDTGALNPEAHSEVQLTQEQAFSQDFNAEFRCPCGGGEGTDWEAVKCFGCGNWLHIVCFGYLRVEDLPSEFFCDICCVKAQVECLSFNRTQSELNHQAVALWRKTLFLLTRSDYIHCPKLTGALDIELPVGKSLMARLKKENFIYSTGAKGKYTYKPIQSLEENAHFREYFLLPSKCDESTPPLQYGSECENERPEPATHLEETPCTNSIRPRCRENQLVNSLTKKRTLQFLEQRDILMSDSQSQDFHYRTRRKASGPTRNHLQSSQNLTEVAFSSESKTKRTKISVVEKGLECK